MNKDDTESDEVCARAREHMLLGLWGRGWWGGEGRGVCVCVWGGGWVKAAFIIVYMYFSFYRGPLIKL